MRITINPKKEVNHSFFSFSRFLKAKNKHPHKAFILVTVTFLSIGLLLTLLGAELFFTKPEFEPEVFVGMDIGYGDEQTAIKLINKVEDYVNLIILGSLQVTTDTQALTRVCDHLYQKNIHFIVFVSFATHNYTPPRGPDSTFFVQAAEKYGEKFLGVYIFDEVGGKLIDGAHSINMTDANNYNQAATTYTHHVDFFLDLITYYYRPAEFPVFTSDYALYWYDYVSGYDVVFTEFVGNNSRQLAAGLCRGAAKTLNKDWGAIITWSHGDLDSFIEDPDQLYQDMVLAYQNGAKYIIVFNSPGFTEDGENPPVTEYGTLTSQHLEKMQNFWNYLKTQPKTENFPANTAYVLPSDYGSGLRGPKDTIWGKWEADLISPQILSDIDLLLRTHVLYLDIIYETQIGNIAINLPYDNLLFWNGTTIKK